MHSTAWNTFPARNLSRCPLHMPYKLKQNPWLFTIRRHWKQSKPARTTSGSATATTIMIVVHGQWSGASFQWTSLLKVITVSCVHVLDSNIQKLSSARSSSAIGISVKQLRPSHGVDLLDKQLIAGQATPWEKLTSLGLFRGLRTNHVLWDVCFCKGGKGLNKERQKGRSPGLKKRLKKKVFNQKPTKKTKTRRLL